MSTTIDHPTTGSTTGSTTGTTPTDDVEAAIGSFAERFVMSTLAATEMLTVELGMRLGLYAALAEAPRTPPELARVAGIDGRYAREWLEQQATAGLVAVDADPVAGDPESRVFSLPVAHVACLLDPDGLAFVAPLATFSVAGPRLIDELVAIYRTGDGISFGGYGEDVRRAQELLNRPQFVNLLVGEWLAAMPDVVARLGTAGARVADVGCGCGWSSVAIARGFPETTIDGFDLDGPSIADARANAQAAGVADRVTFEVRNSTDAAAGTYDLVCCFEALHDMAHPVEALRSMRSMTAPGGTVFVVDEKAADAFTADDPDPMQRLLYAFSVVHCLPVGRSEEDSAATGTVMRTATFERYAADAGFTSVEVLPIDHDMFRFYRLRA